MGKKPKYSPETQRRIVLRLLKGDEPCAALARKYKVSDQTLYRWQKSFLRIMQAVFRLKRATRNRRSLTTRSKSQSSANWIPSFVAARNAALT